MWTDLLMLGVEVPVRALCALHTVDQLLAKRLVLAHTNGIRLYQISYSFYPFGNVRVKKDVRLFARLGIVEA